MGRLGRTAQPSAQMAMPQRMGTTMAALGTLEGRTRRAASHLQVRGCMLHAHAALCTGATCVLFKTDNLSW